LEEHIASIFKVEEAEQETSMKAGGKQSPLDKMTA
jgi:hypothetical protein